MKRNPAFSDRLQRAEKNIANRLKRRGATTTAPTKAFTEASPYHQHLVKLEHWRASDPYLPQKIVKLNPAGDENNIQLVKDISGVKSDLIGKKLLSLLRGVEEGSGDHDEAQLGEVVNVYENNSRERTESSSATVSHTESALMRVRSQSEDSASVVFPPEQSENNGSHLLTVTDRAGNHIRNKTIINNK